MQQHSVSDAIRTAVQPIVDKFGAVPVANALRKVADELEDEA